MLSDELFIRNIPEKHLLRALGMKRRRECGHGAELDVLVVFIYDVASVFRCDCPGNSTNVHDRSFAS